MSGLEIEVVPTQAAYAEALAAFQRTCYPTLPQEELFTADHYRSHVRIFPDGQFTAIVRTPDSEQVAGATTTMRADYGELPAHFLDFIGHNTICTHNPKGLWLYGIDMSVRPAFRGRGISRRLYAARAALVRRLNLRGEFVAGLLPGYQAVRGQMSVEAYVDRVVAGELSDPTLTPQLKSGFRVERLLYGYITDPRSDDVSTLLIRENEDWEMNIILHMTTETDWQRAQAQGSYRAPSLETEGLIHFSMPGQVARIANAQYIGRRDLILLVVDPERLTADLRYEAPTGVYRPQGELFPHLYGPLNLDAVIQVIPYPPGDDGLFTIPEL